MQRVEGTLDDCAHEVLDVVPMAMRVIRKQLREHGTQFLSVPQFRTLSFIGKNRGASLSEVADHIGLTLPSMSTLVDGLVTRNFVIRRTHQDDRRRIDLTLTERGETTLQSARKATQEYLKGRLSRLSETECSAVFRGMRITRQVFSEGSA
jgi:DNA-binding MarR family transcriptional regulator